MGAQRVRVLPSGRVGVRGEPDPCASTYRLPTCARCSWTGTRSATRTRRRSARVPSTSIAGSASRPARPGGAASGRVRAGEDRRDRGIPLAAVSAPSAGPDRPDHCDYRVSAPDRVTASALAALVVAPHRIREFGGDRRAAQRADRARVATPWVRLGRALGGGRAPLVRAADAAGGAGGRPRAVASQRSGAAHGRDPRQGRPERALAYLRKLDRHRRLRAALGALVGGEPVAMTLVPGGRYGARFERRWRGVDEWPSARSTPTATYAQGDGGGAEADPARDHPPPESAGTAASAGASSSTPPAPSPSATSLRRA